MSNNNGASGQSGVSGAMTFKQVKHYLKTHDSDQSEYLEANKVGKLTLKELRDQFQQNDTEIEKLRFDLCLH